MSSEVQNNKQSVPYAKFKNREEYEAWKKEKIKENQNKTGTDNHINCKDYRVKGEITTLFVAITFLLVILFFVTKIAIGILTVLTLVITAIIIWIQQSQLIGSCVKVSKNQFPEINDIAEESAKRLSMKMPDVFIKQDPSLNAYAMGFFRRKSVVLHSATVEAMTLNELASILGHEFSHIKCGHTRLVVLTSSSEGIRIPVLSQILSFVFLFWKRKAEYTCDRGGIIACEELMVSISAMCKLAVGSKLFEKIDIGVFKQQQLSLQQDTTAKISETLSTHPYLIKRIHAVQKFFESDSYCKIKRTQIVKERIQDATRKKMPIQKASFSVSAILISIFSLCLLLGGLFVVFIYDKPKATVFPSEASLPSNSIDFSKWSDEELIATYPYYKEIADAMGKYWKASSFLQNARKDGRSEKEICEYLAKQIGNNSIHRCFSDAEPIEKVNEDLVSQIYAYCFDIKTAESDGFSKEKIADYLLLSNGLKLKSSPYSIDETIEKYRCIGISQLRK